MRGASRRRDRRGLPGRGRRIRQRMPGGGSERQLSAAGRRGGLPGGDGAARRAVVPDGAGDGGAVRAGHGLCGGKRQPAVGVQIRHRGRPGGERRLCQQAGGLQKLELLRGTVHRQLCGLPWLRREVHRGGGLSGKSAVFQGKLRGAGVSQRQRGPSDRDGAVPGGEGRQRRQFAGGGWEAVLPQPGRRVRVRRQYAGERVPGPGGGAVS